MSLVGVVAEIDVQIDKVQRLVDVASREDAELASGAWCSANMTVLQRLIDSAAAAAEDLNWALREALRNGK
jgi:hypothetical protein